MKNDPPDDFALKLARKLTELCECASDACDSLADGIEPVFQGTPPKTLPGAMQLGPFVVVDLRDVGDLKLVFTMKGKANKMPATFDIGAETARWN